MGACAIKPKKVSKSISVMKMPEFTYVDRSAGEILDVKSSQIDKIPFNDELIIHPNSLIGYGEDGTIFIIGGTKPNKKSTKRCFLIDCKAKSINPLPKLPQKVKTAELFSYKSVLYLVDTHKFSILSFSPSSKAWSPLQVDLQSTSLSDLNDFGCCFHQGILYISGGKYGKESFSSDVYEVNLKNEPTASKARLRFPVNLLLPKLVFTNGCKIIAGGFLDKEAHNQKFYVNLNPLDNWKVVDCGITHLTENYPTLIIDNCPVFVAFPFIIVFSSEVFTVFNARYIRTEHFKLDIKEENAEEATEKQGKSEITTANHEKNQISDIQGENLESSNDVSMISGSYVLRARVLTPVNGTFNETSSSYDSDFASQKLFTDDEDQELEESVQNPDGFSDNPHKDKPTPDAEESKLHKNSEINEEKKSKRLPTNRIQQVHSIEVLMDYVKAKEFFSFMIDILQVSNTKQLPEKSANFTLFEFEKILRKFRFKLYPIETFKVITKALDILLEAKKFTKTEKKALDKCAGVEDKHVEFVKKECFINAIILRIKIILLKDKMNA